MAHCIPTTLVSPVISACTSSRSIQNKMSFISLGLAPELLRAVAEQGYTEPTPVQREAIPLGLQGRDEVGS